MFKVFVLFCLLIIVLIPVAVFAQDSYGLEEAANAAGLTSKVKTTPEVLIGRIIKTALSLVGVIFLCLMLYGGFLWMTARGETKMVDKAKETIWSAGIGLVIVLAAYAITHFIIKALT